MKIVGQTRIAPIPHFVPSQDVDSPPSNVRPTSVSNQLCCHIVLIPVQRVRFVFLCVHVRERTRGSGGAHAICGLTNLLGAQLPRFRVNGTGTRFRGCHLVQDVLRTIADQGVRRSCWNSIQIQLLCGSWKHVSHRESVSPHGLCSFPRTQTRKQSPMQFAPCKVSTNSGPLRPTSAASRFARTRLYRR